MRALRLLAACSALATIVAFAHCQDAVRELQLATKTAAGGYVTTLDFDIPVDDDENVGVVIQEQAELLKEVTEASGFTLTGVARLEVEVSMETRPEGMIPARVQFFVAETPTAEELAGDFDVGVVKIEEETVAYTYHKGGLDGVETAFMRVGQWIFGQGLEANGFPRLVVNVGDDDFPIEVQIPVKTE